MKQTRWLSELSCLSEYTRLYPIAFWKSYEHSAVISLSHLVAIDLVTQTLHSHCNQLETDFIAPNCWLLRFVQSLYVDIIIDIIVIDRSVTVLQLVRDWLVNSWWLGLCQRMLAKLYCFWLVCPSVCPSAFTNRPMLATLNFPKFHWKSIME